MKTLSVDIESYSSVDLTDAGVHKYADSDDFEILLFGYSVDYGEVEVVDIAGGQKMPREILHALTDPAVLKQAYNASFERTTIGKYFSMILPPEQWSCSLVLAAQAGLPLGLDAVCKALGLPPDEAKADGRALITYFSKPCKPTITNGGRTRNMPWDDYEKWERYKAYNKRDVEVENTIRKRLAKLEPSETERRFWCLDQKINDRGVKLDLELIRNAIDMSESYTKALTAKAIRLSGITNVNSQQQIKAWLESVEGTKVESLNKKAMPDVLASLKTEEAKKFLDLRSELSKTSVAKFEKMLTCACSDRHARGLFQFYGANRTGRFCLTGDHEVLTKDGWVRLDKWAGGKIACWTKENELVSFRDSEAVSFDYEGRMYTYDSARVSQCSTPDHKMISLNRDGAWEIDTVENFAKKRPRFPFWGRQKTFANTANADQLRVLVMTQADGHYTIDGDLKYGFAKRRKAERCKSLLRKAGVQFHYKTYDNGRRHQFSVASRNVPLWLRQFQSKTFGSWIFDEDPQVFFDELEMWDGYRCGPNSIQYTTTNKTNADLIQAFANISGRSAQMRVKERDAELTPNWNTAYVLDIWLTPGIAPEVRQKPTVSNYSGKVYCAVTPTGFFLVRRNGKVWVTGNSGRLVQLQNLPQNHLADIADVRSLVKAGSYEELSERHPNINSTLSELIRTAIIPEDGCRFIVADFSAIEARVIAWFAHEEADLEEFRGSGKIYELTASRMFGVPKERIVKGNEEYALRAKGKVATLACGYGGGPKALIAMGALRSGISEDELPSLVRQWRYAHENIVAWWSSLEDAAKRAIRTKSKAEDEIGGIVFDYVDNNLHLILPSGRRLCYVNARIGINRFENLSVLYAGQNQMTKKWEMLETYGGKLAENVVQATARDCLRDAMMNLDGGGYDIRMHVHDEVIINEPKDSGRTLEDVISIMRRTPDWAPGLPLNAAGFEAEFYMKD